MAMALQGGCACGAIRYEIAGETLPRVVCCHCRDCQTHTGSAFDLTAFVAPDDMRILGRPVAAPRLSPRGMRTTLHACEVCFTPLYVVHEASPGWLLLRCGTLDDSEAIVPAVHMFTRSKQPWITLPEGVPAYPEFPPADDFRALTGR
ncbi:MAG: GFA family protein [Sphingomonadales bacterium]|nr:GFA family protein [Sphingomonadales bacterium]